MVFSKLVKQHLPKPIMQNLRHAKSYSIQQLVYSPFGDNNLVPFHL